MRKAERKGAKKREQINITCAQIVEYNRTNAKLAPSGVVQLHSVEKLQKRLTSVHTFALKTVIARVHRHIRCHRRKFAKHFSSSGNINTQTYTIAIICIMEQNSRQVEQQQQQQQQKCRKLKNQP